MRGGSKRHQRSGRLTPALAVLLLAPSLTLADSEDGKAIVSGSVEAGGRIISGGDDDGKFQEYRSLRPGAVGEGWFLIEDPSRQRYLEGVFDFVDEDDQRYQLGLGRWGHWGIELEFQDFPHQYSRNGFSPYARASKEELGLSDAWSFADIASDIALTGEPVKLRFRQLNGRANAFYRPMDGLEFKTGYSIQDKRGTQPKTVNNGFAGIAVALPIQERIHEVTAEATYGGEGWGLGVDYLGSIFDNDLDQVSISHPTTDGAFRQRSESPDNQAHQVSLSGNAVLPTDFPSRLAGTFSYSVRLQDDDFVAAAPQSDLDGEVHTILGNLLFTARPTEELNLEARYRIYDFNNESDEIDFGTESSVANEYRRQNATADASYALTDTVTLQAGFEWDRWKRSGDRNVQHSNELIGKFGAIVRPTPRVHLSTHLQLAQRDGNRYDPKGETLTGLRRYDQADRIRSSFDWRATFLVFDDLTFSLFGGTAYDDYEDSDFGVTDDERYNFGADIAYQPFDWLAFSVFYNYDYSRIKQKSADSSDPDEAWRSRAVDHAHNVGTVIDLIVVPNWLDAQLGYEFQHGEGDTNSRADASGTAGNPVDFPDIENTLHIFTSTLTLHVLENLDLIGGYRYEDYDQDDFQFDPLGTNFGDSNIYLNNHVDDYHAHVITLSARYEF